MIKHACILTWPRNKILLRPVACNQRTECPRNTTQERLEETKKRPDAQRNKFAHFPKHNWRLFGRHHISCTRRVPFATSINFFLNVNNLRERLWALDSHQFSSLAILTANGTNTAASVCSHRRRSLRCQSHSITVASSRKI